MKCLLVILTEEDVDAIPLASHLAEASGQEFVVACASRDSVRRLDVVSPSATEVSPEVRRVLDALAAAETSATVYECRAPRPERAILDALPELEVGQLIIPARVDERSDPTRHIVRRLARAAPVDVLLINVGQLDEMPSRVLVPQLGGGGAHAIRYAASHFGTSSIEVRVLADPTASARSRRTFNRVRERLGWAHQQCLAHDVSQKVTEAALAEEVRTADLVLFDVEEAGRVPGLLAMLTDLRAEKPDVPFAVGVTRAEDAAGPGRFERAFERLRAHAPALSRDERRDVYELLERGGRLSTDFAVMLVLSASIAALGLIQSSAAVVIGAMLVAPLMTPLLAMGMALVQGNIQLFRKACKAMAIGVLGALVASMVVGLLSPWSDLSAEVVARGGPNTFDLIIALLSGVAAAFAISRPGLTGTLVGVAIAVALVPPLAAVGIAVVKLEFDVAVGAAVLFLTNLFAIVLGAWLVFRFFGLDAALRGGRAPRWVSVTLLLIAVAMIPTTGALIRNLNLQEMHGVHRPYARPLPASVREMVRARVAAVPGVEIIFMAESNIEHGFGREVALLCPGAVDPHLHRDIHGILSAGLDDDAPVRVLLLDGVSSP